MRLNVNNYQAILNEKGLSDDYVRKATGLTEMTYSWILNREFVECETLERIADAIGCPAGDIINPDYEGYSENVMEWVRDQKRATLSLSQRRTIARVKKLAVKYPDECQIIAENKDGSLYAHVPVEWIRINPGKKLTEEERVKMAERMRRNKLNSDYSRRN